MPAPVIYPHLLTCLSCPCVPTSFLIFVICQPLPILLSLFFTSLSSLVFITWVLHFIITTHYLFSLQFFPSHLNLTCIYPCTCHLYTHLLTSVPSLCSITCVLLLVTASYYTFCLLLHSSHTHLTYLSLHLSLILTF